jgi:hypothetical protein
MTRDQIELAPDIPGRWVIVEGIDDEMHWERLE